MKSYPVSVQLYSAREEAKKDFVSVLKKIASYGYAGVEFAGLHGMKPTEVRKIIDDLGLVASSTHGPMPNKDNANELEDIAKTLGYAHHISGGGPDDFKDKAVTLKTAEKFHAASELLKKHGLTFGIHNHWWEFDKKFDGKLPYDVALEAAPGVMCEIDTYWVKFGGEDPAAIIRNHAKQTQFLHIKDGPLVKDKGMTAVGKGKMDWKSVMAAANDSSVEWLVVELDSCETDMMEAIQQSVQFLAHEGYGKLRK